MATLNYSVLVRKPTRVLTKAWEAFISRPETSPRSATFEDCYFCPLSKSIMLQSDVNPAEALYGKSGYYLLPTPSQWTEGQSAFGDAGGYVSFAGDATFPVTTAWSAYRSASIPVAEDAGLNISLHWVPPSSGFLPQIEFFPRVDFSRYATINGYLYWFAPLRFYIDDTNSMLVVSEYEYDSYDVFETTADSILTPTYQHPLNVGARGISGEWLHFKMIPVIEEWTNPIDSQTYRSYDFVLESPQLRGGGFLYRTRVPRTNISLFPEGCPGIRSFTGGYGTLSVAPLEFASTGYFITRFMSKTTRDSDRPTVTATSYEPDDSAITLSLVDASQNTIPVGSEFQRYRIKAQLDANSNQRYSPVLYGLKSDTVGTAEDRVQDDTDIAAYASVAESVTEDLLGYKATITLYNRNGDYDELALRPMNEIALSVCGVNRALIYTLDPAFVWHQTPDDEALTIRWEGGDTWVRMKSLLVSGMPDYGGETVGDAITDFMERIGFDTNKLSITSSLFESWATLPRSISKDKPVAKPEDGSTADEFIADLREKWFSNYPTYYDGTGQFVITDPLDAADTTNIARVYFLSHADSAAAYAADYVAWTIGQLPTEPDVADYQYFCREPEVTFLHKHYRNEVWVIGVDPATGDPIVDFWIDMQSQTDEDYIYYVGERRIMIVVTRLPSIEYVTWYRDELVKVFGYLKRQISFTTKYDPTLRPGDYISFYGSGFVYQVISGDDDIAARNVSQSYDNTIHNCRIEAVQYPL